MHLIAHITGGGIASKFGEDILFPRRLSAELTDLWEPPPIMLQCQQWRNEDPTLASKERLTDKECYKTWHGGQRVLAVINAADEKQFIEAATADGIRAKVCGKITKSVTPRLFIDSKFNDGGAVEYP
jgi:phosphoribosylaminoimidazole (AIR) synthetase